MWKNFCDWLLYQRLGWRVDVNQPHPDKFIICLAPHTSNWDFALGQIYSGSIGMKINFLMKKEWFFWPLGPIFKALGGIPVYRDKKTSMTDAMAKAAKEAETFRLCIKKGFYYIALKAQLPILLYGVDYEKKLIRCTKTIIPMGDLEQDMRDIKLYFKDFKGKKPENFTIGDV